MSWTGDRRFDSHSFIEGKGMHVRWDPGGSASDPGYTSVLLYSIIQCKVGWNAFEMKPEFISLLSIIFAKSREASCIQNLVILLALLYLYSVSTVSIFCLYIQKTQVFIYIYMYAYCICKHGHIYGIGNHTKFILN